MVVVAATWHLATRSADAKLSALWSTSCLASTSCLVCALPTPLCNFTASCSLTAASVTNSWAKVIAFLPYKGAAGMHRIEVQWRAQLTSQLAGMLVLPDNPLPLAALRPCSVRGGPGSEGHQEGRQSGGVL